MNATILGMTKEEVDQKFEEIVEFSGVEKFIDTPVKRYSSGMMVRSGSLPCTAAPHRSRKFSSSMKCSLWAMRSFKRKCLGKVMCHVAREGRTILFVSHQAAAVENLCTRGVVLDSGRVVFDGTQTEALGFYANSFGHFTGSLRNRTDRKGTGDIRIVAIEMRTATGARTNTAASGQDLELFFHFENHTDHSWPDLKVYINIKNQFDISLVRHGNLFTGDQFGESLPSSGAWSAGCAAFPCLPVPIISITWSGRKSHGSIVIDQIDLRRRPECRGRGDFHGTGRSPSIHDGLCLVGGDWRWLESDAALESIEPTPRAARRHEDTSGVLFGNNILSCNPYEFDPCSVCQKSAPATGLPLGQGPLWGEILISRKWGGYGSPLRHVRRISFKARNLRNVLERKRAAQILAFAISNRKMAARLLEFRETGFGPILPI